MGTWGYRPWDNDSAADWFGDTFDATRLAIRVEETLHLSAEDSAEEIRAAAAVVLLLGHVYIWPIKDLDRHLALAADKLEEVKNTAEYSETPEMTSLIALEIEELRSRIKKKPEESVHTKPVKKWWEFWK